jgi:ABC-type uncharacterized transport system involved in gliding motility auxiliary subunit
MMKMNKWLRGTNATVISVAVIGIFIVLTLFLGSLKGFQLDMTKNKSFTLSEQTTTALSNLKQDVSIKVFTNSQLGTINRDVTDLIQEYKKRSSHITFEEIDMLQQPTLSRQYAVDTNGTLVIESGSQKKTVNFYEIFLSNQQGGYDFSGEEKLTNALTSITSNVKHTVYFLTGHQEVPIAQLSTLRTSLENQNYIVKELNLYRDGKIPTDAEILFAIGPTRDFSDQETQLIREYAKGNGKLYITLGFNKDMAAQWKNIDGILNDFGVKDNHAVAMESTQSTLYDPMTIIPEYGAHAITSKLMDYNLVTMLSLAVAMDQDAGNAQWTATALLKTSAAAYGETDLALLNQGKSNKDAKDLNGPLNLGYALESKDAAKPKAILLGSTAFLVDQEIDKQGNRDFALNSISWLQEQKDAVTIRPRLGDVAPQAYLTPGGANTIFWSTIIIIPLLFLVLGGFIWWRRRRG